MDDSSSLNYFLLRAERLDLPPPSEESQHQLTIKLARGALGLAEQNRSEREIFAQIENAAFAEFADHPDGVTESDLSDRLLLLFPGRLSSIYQAIDRIRSVGYGYKDSVTGRITPLPKQNRGK